MALRRISSRVFFFIGALMTVSVARAVVIDFDDLNYAQVISGTTYAGLTWEFGNPALLNMSGKWTIPPIGSGFPHSVPHNLVNAYGSTMIGISFPSPVDMSGAYIVGQGGNTGWAQSLRVEGFLGGISVGTTPLFTDIDTTPTWSDMTSLTDVDRIVFHATGSLGTEAYYGIDDLTYVPEPAGMSLGLLGLGGVLLRRGRGGRKAGCK